MKKTWQSALWIILGNVLYALTVKLFILPAGLITGGSTGIAIFVNRITGIPVPVFVLIFNVGMLAVGWMVLGKKFALSTVASTFLYPISLHLFDLLLGDTVFSRDPMLCTIFAGIGVGVTLAMVIREGASTGGMDIPPLILQKLFGINVSVSLYVFDCIILLLQASQMEPEMVLYGILLIMIYSVILDQCLFIGASRTEIKVVSQKSELIRQEILSRLDRGVTVLHGEGGYSRNQSEIVLTVVSNRQVPAVKKMIQAVDPEAFLIISRVSEVRGRGFTLSRQYPAESAH